MAMDIIKVEHIYKQYQLGQVGTGTLVHDLNRWWHKLRGKQNPYEVITELNDRSVSGERNEYVWALNDISFTVRQGEVLGIIGRNGAGKSSLLKILSKVTAPTKGSITLHGRVASLLEVGTGFHPELTGKENIYLNGAILGMTKKEISGKFDEIVAFSGVEKYIDTPVKRYSSGMYVRLAFAVAAHLEPEILIVDEVLAVGDVEFQKKCIGKMKDVAGAGRTVLFVSHNMEAVKNLCSRALLLEHGSIVSVGSPTQVIETYLNSRNKNDMGRSYEEQEAPGNEFTRLKSIELKPIREDGKSIITVKSSLEINISVWNYVEDLVANFSLHLYAATGECVFNVITQLPPPTIGVGLHHARCVIPKELLNTGVFYVSFMLVQDTAKPLFNFEEVLTFEVEEERENTNWHGKYPGFVRPNIDFKIIP
jgi:lipopolysaccharide transport system ATP-binding protein